MTSVVKPLGIVVAVTYRVTNSSTMHLEKDHLETFLSSKINAAQLMEGSPIQRERVLKMFPDFDKIEPNFIKNFRALLDAPATTGRQKEQEVQDYIEAHTELFFPQFTTHKGVYFKRIISKFKIGTGEISDFTYVSVDSDTTNIVFVELESPKKKIFTKATRKAIFHADFNAAMQQVEGWRIFVKENRDEIIERLSPLLPHDRTNPCVFRYALVYGRSEEKKYENRKKVFSDKKNETEIFICTFDNLIDAFKNDRTDTLNVLAHSGEGYRYKYMHSSPQHDFAHLLSDKLHLTSDQLQQLRADGYEMDEWLAGKHLKVNSKYATPESALKDAPAHIRAMFSQ